MNDALNVMLLRSNAAQADSITHLRGLLQALMFEHGEFIWRNIEYTDLRGNHFTANLVALLLTGTMVSQPKWLQYALRWLDKEVFLQFYSDGGNIEKSCAYHVFVLELFLLAAVVREQLNKPFPPQAKERLSQAVRFAAAATRPDGATANFGDSDDAHGLPFVLKPSRSAETAETFATQLLIRNKEETLQDYFFVESGYVIRKNPALGFFFMMDVGEVGMKGRGGHGHNDLLSFELWLGGEPIIIDPGTYAYTANLEKKQLYRSSAMHNTIVLGAKEMASILGPWTIANDAIPLAVRYQKNPDGITVEATHAGYAKFWPEAVVTRRIEINGGQVTLHDCAMGGQEFSGYLHLHPQCEPIYEAANIIRVESGKQTVRIEASVPLSLEKGWHSEIYGQECIASVLRYDALPSSEVTLSIREAS